MRMHTFAFTVLSMAALCGEAEAQAMCAELARLRSVAATVVKDMNGIATCENLTRFALAWGGVFRHADEHRLSCQISGGALIEIEARYREALKMRDAVCAGRPLRLFPPEIILQ